MTIKVLFWFQCYVCNTPFLSYLVGQWLYLPDCKINHSEFGQCFYDNFIGEIHSNSYLNPVMNMRKCKKCNKANQLTEFL